MCEGEAFYREWIGVPRVGDLIMIHNNPVLQIRVTEICWGAARDDSRRVDPTVNIIAKRHTVGSLQIYDPTSLVAFIANQIRYHTAQAAEHESGEAMSTAEAVHGKHFHAAEARRLISMLPSTIPPAEKPDAGADQN